MENNNFIPPEVIKTGEGYNIFYKNKYLYPEKNPASRINSKIESLKIQENTLVLIPSPLLYYGIEELISKLEKNCSIVFIEQDKELYHLKSNPYKEYYSLCLENENDAVLFCKDYDFSSFRKIILFPLNSGYFINRSFYNRILDIFTKGLNTFWKNKMTLISLSSRWYSNIFKNLPCFFAGKSISELKVRGPVFIAGAGESLEKSIPLLKKYRDSFTLIAIDTAANTLISYEIKPDFILAVESQFYNMYDFYSCRNSGIPLICDISAYPETLRITGGSNYFFFSEFSGSSFLKYMFNKHLLPDKIPPLGSVGVIAVFIALQLTDSEVIYSGLDFSFIPGKSHSRNSPFITLTSLLSDRTSINSNYSFCLRGDYSKTSDIEGNPVYTTSSLKSYSESLKEIISSSGRIYSLPPAGLVSAKPGTEELFSGNKADVLSNLEEKNCSHEKPGGKAGDFKEHSGTEDINSTDNINIIADFYNSEYKNIKKIIKISVDFLNSRSEESAAFELKNMLAFSDYITENFPEAQVPDELSPPYIKRVLLSCYKYERILGQVIKSNNF